MSTEYTHGLSLKSFGSTVEVKLPDRKVLVHGRRRVLITSAEKDWIEESDDSSLFRVRELPKPRTSRVRKPVEPKTAKSKKRNFVETPSRKEIEKTDEETRKAQEKEKSDAEKSRKKSKDERDARRRAKSTDGDSDTPEGENVDQDGPPGQDDPLSVDVGAMSATVDPGPDGQLGTDDDETTITPKKKSRKKKSKSKTEG